MGNFTIEDMRRFAGEAWGPLGLAIVARWCDFNVRYFGGALRPVPLVISNTLPYGKRLAFCSYNPDAGGRTITLNVPKDHHQLVADNNTLLHEMLHSFCLSAANTHRTTALRGDARSCDSRS